MPKHIEKVNHPKHYNSHPSGVECIDIIEHFECNISNVIKHAWRAGLKYGTSRMEDLEKAAWYANRAVEKEKKFPSRDQSCEEGDSVIDGINLPSTFKQALRPKDLDRFLNENLTNRKNKRKRRNREHP